MKTEYEVTFFFTSGREMLVAYSQEKLDEMWKTIQEAWNNCCVASGEWGLIFPK